MAVMTGLLLRKTATLVVAYSIALQVLLSGLVVGGHASFDPFAAICGSDGAGDHHAPPPQLTAAAPWCVHRLFAARPTPMSFTLAQAAAACGDRTARRMVDLSNDAGVWHVEPVELHRIFPPAPRPDVALAALPLHAPANAATDALVAELRTVIADLRADRDAWRNQAQRFALPKPEPELEPMTLWRWLRSTG
jgi:hypothetical protein